ncbi:Aldo/keto reductase [Punctularia strigosozonata HHB-11173 SS5]|uniref:Aldo/keto reductase n=1 Tax=Punctularia strigosozonata (strain HHB-11173) TaxID=741275 RepID=UPI0004416B67|nr:Aldo/keto reductase [Punctularia strigosozonata HHB-11173 SS5]EIN07863.1 Aldo/keto reductase [Punctularia strigosozonata HHB-11173 SS5]
MATNTSPKSALNIVMGCMTFGDPGTEAVRVSDLKEIEAIIDAFAAHGHVELDTARSYGGGSAESYLAKIDYAKKGLKVQTKLNPTAHIPVERRVGMVGKETISHGPEDLRKWLDVSLKQLNTDCVDLWYLHSPDRTTPYEVTMKAVNELYKEGKFKRFGLSSYMSWEVAQICEICKANGYVQPTVYQGFYNALQRAVEPELFPCLRKYGISFYAFNCLAGGFFTGKYLSKEDQAEPGSRFDDSRMLGKFVRSLYWNDPYFNAVPSIKKAADKHGLSMVEVVLRWTSHHSAMKREFGDAIIIGASSLKYIEQNLNDLEKGPLPEDVVNAVDEAWNSVRGLAPPYYR